MWLDSSQQMGKSAECERTQKTPLNKWFDRRSNLISNCPTIHFLQLSCFSITCHHFSLRRKMKTHHAFGLSFQYCEFSGRLNEYLGMVLSIATSPVKLSSNQKRVWIFLQSSEDKYLILDHVFFLSYCSTPLNNLEDTVYFHQGSCFLSIICG
jgi:hypothetical protein